MGREKGGNLKYIFGYNIRINSSMFVVVAMACAAEMSLRSANMVWSTAMALYRKVPQTFSMYSLDFASTRSAMFVSAY